MTVFELTARTIDPVSVAAGPASHNDHVALDHIPGTVLRGAIAAQWIRDNGAPTSGTRKVFEELFERFVEFGRLMPVGFEVVPMHVWRCKYRSLSSCADTVHDALHEPDGPPPACDKCGGPLEPGKGELIGPGGSALPLLRRTRTELDAHGQVVKGNLFTRAAIRPGTALAGQVRVRDGLGPAQLDWLKGLDERTVWVGGKLTVGGRVLLALSEQDAAPPLPTRRDDGKVALRLAAPGIFVDKFARPALTPAGFDLPSGSSIGGRWARPVTVAGWHAVVRLPKPTDIAVAAGSAYLLDGVQGACQADLGALASSAIGLRQVEGFGAIEVNPPPWTPPVPVPTALSTPAAPAGVQPLAATLRDSLADRDRRWIIGELKALAAAKTTGDAGSDLLAQRRIRRFSPTSIEALGQAVALPADDVEALARALDQRGAAR